MKRLLLLLLFAGLSACLSAAAPIVITSQHPTFAWDAVTKDDTGASLPVGSSVTYEVSMRPVGGTATVVVETSATNTQVTLPKNWTQYELGVRTLLAYGGNTYSSLVAWSTDPVYAPVPFVVVGGNIPATPSNLRAAP